MARWVLLVVMTGACAARPLDLPEAAVVVADLAAPSLDLATHDLGVADLATPDLQRPTYDLTAPPDLAPPITLAISAGEYSACAVVSGAAKCWGSNASGELGDGATADSLSPVGVSGLSSGVQSISVGSPSACAITSSGGVQCWGANNFGQLGNGTTTDSAVPVDVIGLTSGVVAVSATGWEACALTDAGGIKCWGDNNYGSLGNGSSSGSSVPVDVVGLTSGAVAVAVSPGHVCAVTSTGGAKCWGYNGWGELGDNTTTNSSVPVDVVGLSSGVATIVCGGDYSCALTSAGAVKCWGANIDGALGAGGNDNSSVPLDVVGLSSGVVAISAHDDIHTCALTAAGGVKCWGENEYGQLGDGTMVDSNVPVDVVGLSSGVVAISAGAQLTCAVTAASTAKCWGQNAYGELGNGTTVNSAVPVDVLGL